MIFKKDYRTLSSDEQVQVINAVAAYCNDTLPRLSSIRVFQSSDKADYRRGIELMSHFTLARPFCRIAYDISAQFPQYVNRMSHIMQTIKDELASELPTTLSADGSKVIVLNQSQTLRRGRPTDAESRKREHEKQQQHRAEALSNLTGAKVANIEPAPIDTTRETDTSRRKHDEPSLFDQAINDEINDTIDTSTTSTIETSNPRNIDTSINKNISTPSDGDSSPSPTITTPNPTSTPDDLKSLREWSWLLPDTLAIRVKSIRDIRAEIASESEQAKRLFEQGAERPVIEVHTLRARDLNMQLRDTYAQVDRHLATTFLMLTEVNRDFNRLAERYAKHGGYDVLVSDLRPYYDKMSSSDPSFHDTALSRCQQQNAAAIAASQRDPEKEKELHKIKAYFSRKDVKPSASRLAKLREYYEQSKSLGADEDTLAGFSVIISSMEQDLSSNQQ